MPLPVGDRAERRAAAGVRLHVRLARHAGAPSDHGVRTALSSALPGSDVCHGRDERQVRF